MSEPFSPCSLSQGRAQAFQGYTTKPICLVVHPSILHLVIDQGPHGYFCSPASLMNENFSGHILYLLKLGEKKNNSLKINCILISTIVEPILRQGRGRKI